MQPPRDLGHLTAVMAYRESDGLGFDIRMRSRMAPPWNRVPNEALSPIRPKRGVKIAAVVSTSTGLILLAISSIARCRLRRLHAGPVDPRRSRAISIIHAPGRGRFLLTTSRNHLSFATCVMPAQAKRAVAQRAPKSPPKSRLPSRLGVLPEWNLADLYGGIDDPQVKRDLDRAAAESLAFEEDYKGKLAALVERPEAGSA